MRSLPSTYIGRPLVRYCEAVSACLPQSVTRNQVVKSCISPARSLRFSFVATVKLQTGVPCGVYLNSGSRPKLPTSMILLKDIVVLLLTFRERQKRTDTTSVLV